MDEGTRVQDVSIRLVKTSERKILKMVDELITNNNVNTTKNKTRSMLAIKRSPEAKGHCLNLKIFC